MKRNVLILLMFFMVAAQGVAAPVSRTVARVRAQAFFEDKGIAVTRQLEESEGPRRVASLTKQVTPCYYVFNNGEDGGFVIVSGDDRTLPVIAYADKGHFSEQEMPENLRAMLDGYEMEMEALNSTVVAETVTSGPRHTKTPTRNPVYPLMSTQWGQSSPYNNSCPTLPGSSTKCKVGCTGVALAQLLYYYRDRVASKLSQTIPGYTCSTSWSGKRIAVPSVAKGTVINWNNMYDKYDGKQTSTQLTNVANLLKYCAISLKSEFRAGDGYYTTALLSNTLVSLFGYFGFTSTYKQALNRSAYSYEQWKNMVVDELSQGRPLIYYGYSKDGAGHVFIVDGYDGGDLFHVNWGWDGMYNGYFALSILDPYDISGASSKISTTSYISDQKAFFNLQPSQGYTNENDETNLTALINTASSSVASVTYTNNTDAARQYNLGLGYYDTKGNMQLLKAYSSSAVTLNSGSSTTVKYTLAASDFTAAKLAKGTYKVYPVCKLKNDDEWMECEQSTSSYYIKAVYSTSVALSIASNTPSLTVSGVSVEGSCVKGVEQPVVATVTNTGGDFFGTLYLFASTTSTKGSAKASTQLHIPAGKTVNISMKFKPTSAGTYNLWITNSSTGSNVLASSTVKIVSLSSSRNITVTAVTLDNVKSGKTVYGTTLKGVATLKNSLSVPYNDGLYVQLYSGSTSKGWYPTSQKVLNHIKVPAGKTFSLPFEFSGLDTSTSYALVFKYADNSYLPSNYIFYPYNVTKAVMAYTESGELKGMEPLATLTVGSDVLAVDLTGMQSVVKKVVPSSNPNTLYFIGANEAVISGLSGKNVVKGNVAEKIALTDGYGFYTPYDITAKSITYTRKPAIGSTGADGWAGMILPFAATSVKCDGKTIDWFKAADDENKSFWLKEFVAIEGYNTVCFNHVQKMEACRPYIISVPGNKWGNEYNLVGKSLVFSATDATLYAKPLPMTGSDVYNFRGTFTQQKLSGIYALDSKGAYFVYGTATVKPFGCYFISTSTDPTDVNMLNIGSYDPNEMTDAILMPFAHEEEIVDVYNLNGVKVDRVKVVNGRVDIGSLPKGVYVVKGRKLIK